MDDKSFFGSFLYSFFKPFIYSHSSSSPDHYFGPEMEDPSNHVPACSPRDSLLKPNHNNERPGASGGGNEEGFPYPRHPSERGSFSHNDSYHGNQEAFFHEKFPPSNFHDGGLDSLFGFMDKIFEGAQVFHPDFFEDSFDFPSFPNMPNSPNLPNFPNSGPGGFQYHVEEKKDTDIDDSSRKEITSLLKEPPSNELRPAQPSMTSRFHSTSIVRIRRPDGVIEETKKYRDSEGREEVEVITRQPGDSEDLQLNDPFAPSNFPFGDIFKGFPFRIF